MKIKTIIRKIGGIISNKTTVETKVVLTSINNCNIPPIIKTILLWCAARTLKKMTTYSFLRWYIRSLMALAITRPCLLELLAKLVFSRNPPIKDFLLYLIHLYDEKIDFTIVIITSVLVVLAILLNYFGKRGDTQEIIRRQILESIRPIVTFDEFNGFYKRHEVKQFVDDETYKNIRKKIVNRDCGNLRLLALPGTGKTFLVQTAFMEAGETSNVFYCEEPSNPQILTAALNLKNEFQDATLILDNCRSVECERITSRVGERVRVISLYYDPTDNAEGTNSLNFNGIKMKNIVTRIIKENISVEMSPEEERKIIKRSGNIPFMALLLVHAFNDSKGASYPIDKERDLMDHLLDIKGDNPKEQRIAIRTLALFQPLEYDGAKSKIAKFIINSNIFTPIEQNINRNVLFRNTVKRLGERSLIDNDTI